VQDRIQLHLGGGKWLAPLLLKSMAWRTGIDPAQLRPIVPIASIVTPKLLIVGGADQHTPITESMDMYRQASPPKQLWVVEGARHVDLYHFDASSYRARVGAFLETYLSRPGRNARLDMPSQPGALGATTAQRLDATEHPP
jgi:pimeloyl-ACP methyl ester carboxylesterase